MNVCLLISGFTELKVKNKRLDDVRQNNVKKRSLIEKGGEQLEMTRRPQILGPGM